MLKIYIIAGEASGDNIGAKLMRQMKLIRADLEFYGVGGPKMQQEGMNLLFASQEIAFMGFLEVIPHLFTVLKKIKQTADHIRNVNPDIIITIDAPGFCFRVIKSIKNKVQAKLVHYVAPTVWAYKEGRAKKIAALYDLLLVILPFEKNYFIKEGLKTVFVGHPAIEDLKIYPKDMFRKKFNIAENDILLCLTPGSRKQEIKTLLPIFFEAIKALKQKIIIAVPTLYPELVNYLNVDNLPLIIVGEENKLELFSSADLALTKSGTITTELAFYKIPMVVAHKVNVISYWLLKRMVKVAYVTIVNIIANKEIIPELLQDKCNADDISQKLNEILTDKASNSKETAAVIDQLKIKEFFPSELAAKVILEK